MKTEKNKKESTLDPSDNPMAQEVTLLSGLMGLGGGAAIILSFWVAIVTGIGIGKTIYILLYVDGFHQAEYTVTALRYVEGDMRSSQRTYDKYFALGTINGIEEQFGLGDYVKGVINSQEELEHYVSVGQVLPVLYNPDAPKHLHIRVQYPEKDFKKKIEARQKNMINTAYMPWIIANAFCLFFGIVGKKWKTALKISIGSCFFVIFAWVPTLLNLWF